MGKSIRSKSKRSFRAKKRDDSVYAAVHAARLNRLHRKLKEITLTDKDGDLEVEDVSEFEDERQGGEGTTQGWCSHLLLGLIDPEDITTDRVGNVGRSALVGLSGRRYSRDLTAPELFPHLFPDPDQSAE